MLGHLFRIGLRSLDETAVRSGSGADELGEENRVTREGTQLDATGLSRGANAPARSPRPKMQKRLPMPTSIPTGNAHNILLHVEHGPRDERDRVLQIAREGLAAARQARHTSCLFRRPSRKSAAPGRCRLRPHRREEHLRARVSRGCPETVPRHARWGLPDEELSNDPRSPRARARRGRDRRRHTGGVSGTRSRFVHERLFLTKIQRPPIGGRCTRRALDNTIPEPGFSTAETETEAFNAGQNSKWSSSFHQGAPRAKSV
jgi:hypothetical protein